MGGQFSGVSDGAEICIRQPQFWQTIKSPSRWNWQPDSTGVSDAVC